MKLKCTKCKNEWNYKGSNWYASCSSCKRPVKVPEEKLKEVDKNGKRCGDSK